MNDDWSMVRFPGSQRAQLTARLDYLPGKLEITSRHLVYRTLHSEIWIPARLKG